MAITFASSHLNGSADAIYSGFNLDCYNELLVGITSVYFICAYCFSQKHTDKLPIVRQYRRYLIMLCHEFGCFHCLVAMKYVLYVKLQVAFCFIYVK